MMDLSALRPLLLLLCLCGLSLADDILPDGPLDALEGSNVTFKTLMKDPEFIAITWSLNDKGEIYPVATRAGTNLNVPDKYTGRADMDTNGQLTLTGLTVADSGEYSISIIDNVGNTRAAEIELRVMVPVSDVVIKSSVPEAREMGPVVLTCTAKGTFLRFKWFNDSTAITTNEHMKVERTDTTSTLSFPSVYRSDLVGPIFCEAYNTLTSAKSSAFSLNVNFGPERLTVSSVPEFVAAGSNFSLTCSAMSNPPAVYNWIRDGKQTDFTDAVLTLKFLEELKLATGKASYVCNATNPKTKDVISSAPATFTVVEKVTNVKMSAPSGKLLAGNSTANITCSAAKGSMQMLEWQKNGAALSADRRVVIAADKKSVQISPLQKEDNAEFTCIISNPVSKDMAKIKLTVFYGPEPVQLKGDSEVEVTDFVKLECSAPSMPRANYTWKYNGTMTKITSNIYTIEKAIYANTGTYTCVAHNAETGKSSSKSHFLAVKEEGALDEGLSDGAIAGIVIGVLAAVALAIGIFIYCRQKVPLESPY